MVGTALDALAGQDAAPHQPERPGGQAQRLRRLRDRYRRADRGGPAAQGERERPAEAAGAVRVGHQHARRPGLHVHQRARRRQRPVLLPPVRRRSERHHGDRPGHRPARGVGQILHGLQRHRAVLQQQVEQPPAAPLQLVGAAQLGLGVAGRGRLGDLVHGPERQLTERGDDAGVKAEFLRRGAHQPPGVQSAHPQRGLQRVQAAALQGLAAPEFAVRRRDRASVVARVGDVVDEKGECLDHPGPQVLAVRPVGGPCVLGNLTADLFLHQVGDGSQLGAQQLRELGRHRRHAGAVRHAVRSGHSHHGHSFRPEAAHPRAVASGKSGTSCVGRTSPPLRSVPRRHPRHSGTPSAWASIGHEAVNSRFQ